MSSRNCTVLRARIKAELRKKLLVQDSADKILSITGRGTVHKGNEFFS